MVEDGFWQQPVSAKVPSCRSLSRSKGRGKRKRHTRVLKGFHISKMIAHPRQPLPGVNTVGSYSHTKFGSLYMLILPQHCQTFLSQTLETKRRSPRVMVLPLHLFSCPSVGGTKSDKSMSVLGLSMAMGYNPDLGMVPCFREATGDTWL